jgi:hypothetical protein
MGLLTTKLLFHVRTINLKVRTINLKALEIKERGMRSLNSAEPQSSKETELYKQLISLEGGESAENSKLADIAKKAGIQKIYIDKTSAATITTRPEILQKLEEEIKTSSAFEGFNIFLGQQLSITTYYDITSKNIYMLSNKNAPDMMNNESLLDFLGGNLTAKTKPEALTPEVIAFARLIQVERARIKTTGMYAKQLLGLDIMPYEKAKLAWDNIETIKADYQKVVRDKNISENEMTLIKEEIKKAFGSIEESSSQKMEKEKTSDTSFKTLSGVIDNFGSTTLFKQKLQEVIAFYKKEGYPAMKNKVTIDPNSFFGNLTQENIDKLRAEIMQLCEDWKSFPREPYNGITYKDILLIANNLGAKYVVNHSASNAPKAAQAVAGISEINKTIVKEPVIINLQADNARVEASAGTRSGNNDERASEEKKPNKYPDKEEVSEKLLSVFRDSNDLRPIFYSKLCELISLMADPVKERELLSMNLKNIMGKMEVELAPDFIEAAGRFQKQLALEPMFANENKLLTSLIMLIHTKISDSNKK